MDGPRQQMKDSESWRDKGLKSLETEFACTENHSSVENGQCQSLEKFGDAAERRLVCSGRVLDDFGEDLVWQPSSYAHISLLRAASPHGGSRESIRDYKMAVADKSE
ncbi:hypothetical protein FB45DRAFT_871757 [Roridomyces roridus]|uniref:Uncharacterized protein n=1 Tax=Roridomyces roridus TaxID=1738132 RepID=A0AAD7BFI1_9AGAR|nr:hypothetical protein FB45DRAFT_871757 [Roridomyces roridus]